VKDTVEGGKTDEAMEMAKETVAIYSALTKKKM